MLLNRLHDVSGDFPGNVFLITGEKNILLDAGMAHAGEALCAHIQKVFDANGASGGLDYIFLSHSHYDHISGVPYLKRHWPDAQVVIAPYGKRILEKPTALALMRSMNDAAAETQGLPHPDYRDDELRADLTITETDAFDCGDYVVTAIETPGHTKDCISVIIKEKESGESLVFCSESMATYTGPKYGFIACHLTGFYDSLCSIRKTRALNADHLLLPHYGAAAIRDREEALASSNCADRISPEDEKRLNERLFDEAEAALLRAAYRIRIEAEKDIPADEKVKNLSAIYWPEGLEKFQPYAAYAANMHAMLRTIMNETAFDKPSVRRQVKARRRELTLEDKAVLDAAVLSNLTSLLSELYPELPYLYAYVSYAKETDTLKLIEQKLAEGKSHIIVPRVNGERMDMIEIHSMDDLEPGCMGIPEPKASLRPLPEIMEVTEQMKTAPIVTPGLGFTRGGKRCGYGGGFYDKFFEDEPNHPKIAICYSFQIMENIEVDPFDQLVDYIVTENEVIRCK